ncbi:MAG: AAA family ATPase [Proteobacteria bacterium]|nr:AAA family ATPase [Pseudomonadota bacterium]MBU1389148.1 AAA family ATPase [Pseudomonadota bacterium]MBU1543372.1 AAA family ATPase [Pseudomonadota bacterium]MBU2431757.1 AAA family ATPase [Pseudomonadota bacterium]MBU2481460.1 AAA family ATPase [Pseudomonadota bacterium]
MYTSFYKFNAKPFQISSDPDFLWLGEKHKEALATLKYGVLDNKGFLLLTGDVGTGKTTLIHSLIESLSNDIIYASVPDPSLGKLDFFNYIAQEFGMDQEFSSKGKFLVQFRKFLIKAHEDNKKVLLIIDEAQLLTQELLEEIRLLSNIEKTHVKLINIFFVGQNEFNEILSQTQNRAVRQRLTLNYNIDPLTPSETCDYVKFRLKKAGVEKEIFDPEALRQIFLFSGGFPRRINIICDHALLSGYVQEIQTIGVDIIKECAKELKIPVYAKQAGMDSAGINRPPIPSPRTVILQPAPYKLPEKQSSPYLLWILAGLIAVCLIVFWLLYPDVISRIQQNIRPVGTTQSALIQKNENPAVLAQQIPEPKTKETEQIESVPEPMAEEPIPDQSQDISVPPQTSEIQSVKESGEGEPEKTILALPDEKIIIRFKYNSNEFSDQGLAVLQDFSKVLSMHPEAKIKITGYSDSAGYEKYNDKLSEFRANIVKSFLLGNGANPGQIEVQGLGSVDPVESNDTVWGRMMNRRVEIEVIK